MNSHRLVKSGRPPAGNAAASTMTDATALAIKRSKQQFTSDMRKLLNEAKRYFGDVSWRLDGDDEVIYGHRAILYARANAAFQSRFLNPNGSARLQAIMSGSSLSLQTPPSSMMRSTSALHPEAHSASCSASPGAVSVDSFRSSPGELSPPLGSRSPIPVSGTDSAFFKSLLDFFYTASTPLGEVFTFLFEDSSYVDKEDALDRLSQDLLFMWRSKLFADMHIQLSETIGLIPEDEDDLSDTPTISEERTFPAHRALLAARCPYFSDMFLTPYSDSEAALFTLPSPPFTPAALHFILAYLYTGSLSINRTFDLSVAMDIWKSATYLNHDILQEEIQCRMVDMCHAFRACCKTCRNRAVRIYVFSTSPEVNARYLQLQAKNVVSEHFGELWDKEIGNLPYSVQKDLLVDKCSETNARNAAAAMKGIMRTRSRLASERNASWAEHIRSMLIPLEDRIKHFLKTSFAEVATSKSFIELVEGIGFSNDVLERLLTLLIDSLSEKNAATTYEILVGKLLLREEGIAVDARARLEDARLDILKYVKARWVGIRAQNGFEHLENWCLKELSDELEQPVDELLQSTATTPRQTTRTGLKLSNTKVHKVDSDAFSIASAPASLRASVLNRNTARKSTARSSAHTSMFSINPEDPHSSPDLPPMPVASTSSSTLQSAESSVRRSNPQSRATSAVSSDSPLNKAPTDVSTTREGEASPNSKSVSPAVLGADEKLFQNAQSGRVESTRSRGPVMTKAARLRQSSTASKLSAQDGSSRNLGLARPTSSSSLRSKAVRDSSGTRRTLESGSTTATSANSRPVTPSQAVSVKSVKLPSIPIAVRASKANDASSSQATPKSPVAPASPKPFTASRPSSVTSLVSKRRPSVSSLKSTRSTASKKSPARKATSPRSPVPPLPDLPSQQSKSPTSPTSQATCVPSTRPPPGVLLKIGIPCVVTHGQTKFKATVRYLGEVFFDSDSYVGVEVSADSSDLPEGLRWTDGTVDGVRYFDLTVPRKSNRAQGVRRPTASTARKAIVKAETAPSVTRGLFVKPSQVVYVF